MPEPLLPEPLLVVYCILIILASVAGGQMSKLFRMTHLRTQLLMSGVSGLMLGIAMLHLLPHATEVLGSPSKAGYAALAGLIAMFLLVRLFHTHDHGVVDQVHDDDDASEHHTCDHPHHHHEHGNGMKKGFSWAGMFFGLALHTIIDGVALTSSVLADFEHGAWLGLYGLGTFLAVALHKPLDAFAITSVMGKQGWSDRAQGIASGLFSIACPLGAVAMYFGVNQFAQSNEILGWGLAISAGFFICIALADLLPEVAFHDHDRGKLTLALLFGVAIAVGIESLPGHEHEDHQGHKHASPGVLPEEQNPKNPDFQADLARNDALKFG